MKDIAVHGDIYTSFATNLTLDHIRRNEKAILLNECRYAEETCNYLEARYKNTIREQKHNRQKIIKSDGFNELIFMRIQNMESLNIQATELTFDPIKNIHLFMGERQTILSEIYLIV